MLSSLPPDHPPPPWPSFTGSLFLLQSELVVHAPHIVFLSLHSSQTLLAARGSIVVRMMVGVVCLGDYEASWASRVWQIGGKEGPGA